MRLVRSDSDHSRIRTEPFPEWPRFSPEAIDAACQVLKSGAVNYWTGPEGRLFEHEFAQSVGRRYGVAVTSGTAALELALLIAGVRPNDEVILAPRTFFGCASAVVLIGAVPVFADVDPVTQNITAESIKAVMTEKTSAIIAVHLAGWPCEMDSIMEIARPRGIKVIEDCAQAQGAEYKGNPVGSIGDVGVFSFCHDKIMSTAGEGGMLVMDENHLWEKAWSFKENGKSFEAVFIQQHPPGFRWQREMFGTNWRLTEVQSAIGRTVLQNVPEWLEIRRRNAAFISERIERIPALRVTSPPEYVRHAYYKYYVFVRPEKLRSGWTRDRIMVEIQSEGIPCYSGSCSEVYRENAFRNMGLPMPLPLPVAKQLGRTSLMFDVHPSLTEMEMDQTARAVEKVMRKASAN